MRVHLGANPIEAGIQSLTRGIVRWAGDTVEAITVESTLTPPVTMLKPLAQGAPASVPSGNAAAQGAPAPPPATLMSLLKPKITIYNNLGDPIVLAPYGEPGEYRLPSIIITAAVIFGGVFWLGYVAGKSRRR